jgi:hypothetical protein
MPFIASSLPVCQSEKWPSFSTKSIRKKFACAYSTVGFGPGSVMGSGGGMTTRNERSAMLYDNAYKNISYSLSIRKAAQASPTVHFESIAAIRNRQPGGFQL